MLVDGGAGQARRVASIHRAFPPECAAFVPCEMTQHTMIRTELLTGPAITHHLADLARLRRIVFRAWPYLYDGATASNGGMDDFAASRTAGLVIARDGDTVVGAATCLSLAEEEDHITTPFRAAGIALDRVFYFGESVLLPAYRGQGVGVAFFAHREAHARGFAGVDTATFCTIQPPDDHPLRPKDAVKLDAFWGRRGYAPTNLYCTMAWKQIDTPGKVSHTLRFWTKALA
jgi:GNAT superfamily N-acetyltransferase